MDNQNLQQENEHLKSQVEQLQSKLNAIDKSNQQKTKFQLWLGRVGVGFLLGAGLKSSMRQLYQELPNKVQKDTVADVTTNVIWRLTRIGLFGVLIALIPTMLLWQQNQLLNKQNEKIDSQIQLEESNRRGALIVMMSNIMDKLDEELKERKKQGSSRALSKQLIGRIAALSYSFRPYRFWQDNSLIEKPLSPERGQLLLALVKSDLDSLTYRNIYEKATFVQAYLKNANLRRANLVGVYLADANLERTLLTDANLTEADLTRANLADAYLADANLTGADMRGASLTGVNWRRANLTQVNWKGTDLRGAILTELNLRRANLTQANLSETDLTRANLSKTDLTQVNLNEADLRDANLTGAKVEEKDWMTKLEEWNVYGKEQILKKYKVDTTLQQDFLGNEYYPIKPKS